MKSVPIIPSSAPFSPDQRAWLNGFLAAWLGEAGEMPTGLSNAAPQEPLLILYGSQSGNAEGLAKRIGKESATQGYQARVLEMAQAVSLDFSKESRLVCITSTWGDGEMPDNAKPFWDYLNSDLSPSLANLQFSVLALGDRNYPAFCQAGKDLETKLAALGGKRIHPLAECDVDYETPAKAWIEGLWPALKGVANGTSHVNGTNGASKPEKFDPKYSRKNPFSASLKTNQNLNGAGSEKEVRHIEIDLAGSELTYEVGDALGVFSKNDPALVEAILKLQGWSGNESVPLPDGGTSSIQEALLQSYEITKLSPKLLEAATQHGAELKGLLEPAKKKELDAYLWGRDLLDLFQEFPALKWSPEACVTLLKKLNVRLYSIASSLKAHPGEVHLTVGAVRFETHGRKRGGVCSTFLADRVALGGAIPVFVQVSHGFRPPQNPETPMIMVGPGTGIAPFRAFLEERKAIGAKGKNWLFFGDQRIATDFLYRDELGQFQKEGYLAQLDTAFSRDQATKIYVQNRMLENAKDLWSWLESGAHFYVCGDASRMAKDVDAALHQIVQEQGGKSAEAAADYVKQLKTDKRYQRDVY